MKTISNLWELRSSVPKNISQELSDYPLIVRQLFFNRGIKSKNEAEKFFDSKDLKFHRAIQIYKIREAAQVILKWIKDKKKIFIHGDFDVDGICASSILWDFLYRHLKADITPYVPSRFKEGYGMSDRSLTSIQKQGGEAIITVDCGIKDKDLIEKWSAKGMEFVVTDHHEFEKIDNKVVLPSQVFPVVHPRHPEGKYPFGEISGAAVAWKLVSVLADMVEEDLDIEKYLDLVALSTVCDVMPLIDENRSFVKKGIVRMRKTEWIGLRQLLCDAKVNLADVDTYHMGFVIGPRLNAAGRLEHAIDAIRLLVTGSQKNARRISGKLETLNQRRQKIQREIYEDAVRQIEISGIDKKLYFVWADDWAEGVIGIVAGKISEIYHRPVLIATRKGDFYTGSARSIGAFNIVEAISSQAKLLERFGGHAAAAGFVVSSKNFGLYRDNLLAIADKQLSHQDMQKKQIAECEISLDDIDTSFLEWIDKFSPFGYKNSRPKFIIKGAGIADVERVGKTRSHLRLTVLNKSTGEYLKGIGFGLGETFQDIRAGDEIDILFSLEMNEWNGRKNLQLNIKDIKKV